MAFAGTIAPRRKTTTYGKHSHRPISTLSSVTEIEFAQDPGPSISDPKGTLRHWQGDGGNVSSNLLHGHSEAEARPEKLAHQALSTRPQLRDQDRSSPSLSDSTKDVSLHDIPLWDDNLEHNNDAARKRRKVVPSKIIADKHSPVYDDESLQRHIAAEARQDDGQVPHSPGITSAVQNPRLVHPAVKSQATARWSPKKCMSKTSKDRTLGPKRNLFNAKTAERTEDPLVARKHSKRLVKPKVTPYRTQDAKTDHIETTARLTAPDTVFEREYPQGKNTRCPNSPVCQPTTPPRPTGAANGGTSPRQRELWDRLLVNNAQVRDPSSRGLLSLLINEKKPKDSHGYTESRRFRRSSTAALKARPPRIVDTLHRSDQDQDHFSDDCNEPRGSSSSDNKSESMHSEKSAADGVITVQTSPSADSQGLASQYQDCSTNASQTIPSLHGGALKITYARQRSYLTDNDMEEAVMTGLPVPPESKNRRGYGQRRLGDHDPRIQPTKSLSKESEDLADSRGGIMRSIHELREAGGNVRLVSELEAILDDIGDHQPCFTSIRRSKLIDLVTKLEEPANCRLFVDQGLECRLVAEFGLGNDLITHGLLVAALLQVMTFSSSTGLLTHVTDVRVVKLLVDLLGSDQDILSHARLRESNMSKAAQADLQSLCSTLLKSTAWRAGKPSVLSCHVLSLQCLEYLVRQTREAGSMSEILSAYAVKRIVASSLPAFSTLPPQPGKISIICLELAVSILESCTISNAAERKPSLWAGETLERVIGLLPLLSLWKGEECGTSQTLTLRLYLNLTNNSPGLCEDFSTPEVIGAMFRIVISHFDQLASSTPKKDKTLLLDDLILSLGSLINLADLSRVARELVVVLRYGSQSYLDALLNLFTNKVKNVAEVSSLEETSSNVAFGWVSVLLGWLCLNPAIKARVKGRLPGNSLKQLLDAVEEFLRYHRRVEQVILRSDAENDARVSFIGRLQSHVDDLKKIEGSFGTLNEVAGVGN